MRPASYSLPEDLRATSVRVIAYMGGLALLAIAAASFLKGPAGLTALTHSPRPQWTRVERPYPAFGLVMPNLPSSAFDYAILRRAADGARKDILTWGAADGSGPFIVVEIFRPGVGNERFIDAESEIAARIVGFTVTDDVKQAGQFRSKFGAVPLVDFAIAVHGRERRCLGFARPFERPFMQIAGWYCSPGDEVIDRPALACVLDRLTMVSAGGDTDLAGVFAQAELNRTFCGQRNPILAATPERELRVIAPRRSRARAQAHPP